MSDIARDCPNCDGHGYVDVPVISDPADEFITCPTCDGAKRVVPVTTYRGAVDLIRRAEPYVRAARHESGVTEATALADEMAALLPETGGQS